MSTVKLANAMLQYVAATSALNDRLLAERRTMLAEKQAAAAQQGPTLQLMLQHKAVDGNEKKATAEWLGSHEKTLELLGRAVTALGATRTQVEKMAAVSATSLGQPEKTAQARPTANSLTSPFVGAPTSQRRASDDVLRGILNSPAGT